ncbi:hypothetical protein [Clostridium aciditolerans]|uniref:Uncharacterized protein n=1 Tax=Clostridium aciditolerans TaxID=339861 RepID=A0A934M7E2_9CLOT|nr:hypothetical protein [Clostridium aciditolerans]MBI6875593.1 hypothetical protein [Clostridium aciditolerans]
MSENTKTIDINKPMNELMEEDFFKELTNIKKTEKKYNSSRLSQEELKSFKDGSFWDNL